MQKKSALALFILALAVLLSAVFAGNFFGSRADEQKTDNLGELPPDAYKIPYNDLAPTAPTETTVVEPSTTSTIPQVAITSTTAPPQPSCNPPMAMVAGRCCLDINNNGLCDSNERPNPVPFGGQQSPTTTILLGPRNVTPMRLEAYVASTSPLDVRAVSSLQNLTIPLDDIDFRMHYIATYDNLTGNFTSPGGPGEVDEDIRQLCAMKYYHDGYRYLDYVWCRSRNVSDPDWRSCLSVQGMDTNKISSCLKHDEGKKLLIADLKYAQDRGVREHPTWYANSIYRFAALTAEEIADSYCKHNKGRPGCYGTGLD